MLTEQQVDNLLFEQHNYFDCDENCSQYTHEELENILIHLANLSDKYFNRIMKLYNDPSERSDKNTARNVMNNAYNKVYKYYLKKTTTKPLIIKTPVLYNIYIICVGIILSILLYFII